jgi:hypothetical protein
MVSAEVHGTVRITVRSPAGNSVKVFQQRTEATAVLTGSSEGVISNTPEKWLRVGLVGDPKGKPFYGGCELVVSFIPDANATLDISDARWVIPITLANGTLINLSNNATDMNGFLIGDNTVVAAVEGNLGIHRAPEGRYWYFGGGSLYISVMDNA